MNPLLQNQLAQNSQGAKVKPKLQRHPSGAELIRQLSLTKMVAQQAQVTASGVAAGGGSTPSTPTPPRPRRTGLPPPPSRSMRPPGPPQEQRHSASVGPEHHSANSGHHRINLHLSLHSKNKPKKKDATRKVAGLPSKSQLLVTGATCHQLVPLVTSVVLPPGELDPHRGQIFVPSSGDEEEGGGEAYDELPTLHSDEFALRRPHKRYVPPAKKKKKRKKKRGALSKPARCVIALTGIALLLMCFVLVGVTLRLAPLIDEMVRKENEGLLRNLSSASSNSSSNFTAETEVWNVTTPP